MRIRELEILVEKLHSDLALECAEDYGCYLCDRDRAKTRAANEMVCPDCGYKFWRFVGHRCEVTA